MVECLQQAAEEFDAQVKIDTERMYSAFYIDENDEIVNIVRQACDKIGLKSFTQASGGGSDTNILNGNGIKAVNLGIGEKKPHTLEEHLKIEDLVNSARLVLEIIKTVA
jgi:tripeptide aminopeptidase